MPDLPAVVAQPPPSLAERIDAVLPQTQCTKCGHAGCRPYADALAAGTAELNQCPPGGAAGIAALAQVLGRAPLPLNPAHGVEQPLAVALIDESLCIGCTLCIQACPVDAIVGAPRRMHTVFAALCTGCDLCVAPCPMDCIAMVPVDPPRTWNAADAAASRARFEARKARLVREHQDNDARLAARALARLEALRSDATLAAPERERKRTIVEAAIARARSRRAGADRNA